MYPIRQHRLGCVVFVLVAICISSCCTFDACVKKYGATYVGGDTIVIDTIVKVQAIAPKDSIRFSVQIDSFLMLRPIDTLTFNSGRAVTKLYKDEHNNYLQGETDCLEDTIFVQVPVQIAKPCPEYPVFVKPDPPWWETWWKYYANFMGAFLPLWFLVTFLVRSFINLKS